MKAAFQKLTKRKWWRLSNARVSWHRSLLVKYLILVLSAMVFWIFVMPLSAILIHIPTELSGRVKEAENPYFNGNTLMKEWHAEAKSLRGADQKKIDQLLEKWKAKLPKSSIFWVDNNGRTVTMLPFQKALPKQWNAQDSIDFMKKSYDSDPFTVVSFIGGGDAAANQGFMVIQIPRELMIGPPPLYANEYAFYLMMFFFGLFVLVSWRFFYRIMRRLTQLEKAMATTDDQNIPVQVHIEQEDEIGQLEHSFNRMTSELRISRKREQEEEKLRKELIANLSHDIRTPLTILRTHVHTLQEERNGLQEKGQDSLRIIVQKCDDIAHLVDNLLSYTLLSGKRYTFQPKPVEMTRLVRENAAAWYPIWEKHQFEIDIALPDDSIVWNVDTLWMKRILDNVFQNIVRHAASGRYVKIEMRHIGEGAALIIQDKGPGMKAHSQNKGAGVGLSIVHMMLQEMKLEQRIQSSSEGTTLYFYPTSQNNHQK